MSERCKAVVTTPVERVYAGNPRCAHPATRDGFCGTHHPDAVRARDAKRRTLREKDDTEYLRDQARATVSRFLDALPLDLQISCQVSVLRARLSTWEPT